MEQRKGRKEEEGERMGTTQAQPETYSYLVVLQYLFCLAHSNLLLYSQSLRVAFAVNVRQLARGNWYRCRRQRRHQRHNTPCRGVGGFSEVPSSR